MQSNLSPLVVGTAAAIFLAAAAHPAWALGGRLQDRLAPTVLGVYLIHPLVIEGLWRVGLHVHVLPAGVGAVAVSLLVGGLALVATLLLQAVPGLRRLV